MPDGWGGYFLTALCVSEILTAVNLETRAMQVQEVLSEAGNGWQKHGVRQDSIDFIANKITD